MKKNEVKKPRKLQLSKETLRSLTVPETRMAMGASGASLGISCQSNCQKFCMTTGAFTTG